MTRWRRSLIGIVLLWTLAACATTSYPSYANDASNDSLHDPWETGNRRIHAFNQQADRVLLRPAAKAYVTVTPKPLRRGLNNVFTHLRVPVSVFNLLLQGRGRDAGEQTGRFLINTVYGVGGLWDVASDGNLPNHNTDFGLTLASWGWQESRFVMLPLLGPSTLRDGLGRATDRAIDPAWQIMVDELGWSVPALSVINTRTNLLPLDEQLDSAFDSYTFLRDSWLQRRQFQIHGDDNLLPDYDAFLDELDEMD